MAAGMNTYRIKDVMTPVVIGIGPDETIQEALDLMAQYRVTVLPVSDNKNRCVGILSSSDLIDPARAVVAQDSLLDDLSQKHVRDLMSKAVVAVERETSVLDAAGEMLRHRVHHLPVVDRQHKVLGIVSTMDLLSILHRHHAEAGQGA